MADPFETEGLPRCVTHLIFMVDTSSCMDDLKIESLNTTVREALLKIGEKSRNYGDFQIKIAVMEFNDDAKWMYPQPIDAENFKWQNIEFGCKASFGKALAQLNAKLSKLNGFMAESTGCRLPVIVLVSDGKFTDKYEADLESLKSNLWFRCCAKFAITINADADKNALAKFTDSVELVGSVHDIDLFDLLGRLMMGGMLIDYAPKNSMVDWANGSGLFTNNAESDDWSGWK